MREGPQGHSYEKTLVTVNELLLQNNPDGVQDAISGRLGADAVVVGGGNIADASTY